MTAKRQRTKKRKRRPQERPRWRKEELRLLLRLHPNTSNFVIARRLQRTLQGVASMAHKLQLKKKPARLVKMGKENIARRWGKRGGSKSREYTPGRRTPRQR